MRRGLALMPTLSRVGLGRVMASASHLPEPAASEVRAMTSTPRAFRNGRDELSVVLDVFAQARALTSLEDRPLAVLTASENLTHGRLGRRPGPARRALDRPRAPQRGLDPRRPARGRAPRGRVGPRDQRGRRRRPQPHASVNALTTPPRPITHTTTRGAPMSHTAQPETAPHHAGPHPAPPAAGPRTSWALLAVALAAQILVVLDISVVNTALPSIGECAGPPGQPAAVAGHGLPDDVRRRPAARRPHRRPALPTPGLPDRAGPVHRRLPGQRVRRQRQPAHRHPRASRA